MIAIVEGLEAMGGEGCSFTYGGYVIDIKYYRIGPNGEEREDKSGEHDGD